MDLLLSNGADPNASNSERRTPLHNAIALGHVAAALSLFLAGGLLTTVDAFGVTPIDMLTSPGAVSKEDASLYFNVTQRATRSIHRIENPELFPDSPKGWKAGTGGWGPERLDGMSGNMRCDVDEYWAHELTGKELFSQYLARSRPVLIRGLLDDWKLVNSSTHDNLRRQHGNLKVRPTSCIDYLCIHLLLTCTYIFSY